MLVNLGKPPQNLNIDRERNREKPIIVEPKRKKDHNHNNKTSVIAVRLPNDVLAIIERRAKKKNMKPSEWLRGFVIKDARRKR